MFPSTLTTQRMILNHVREILAATIVFVISCAPSELPERTQTLGFGPVRQIDRAFDGAFAYESVRYFTQFWCIAGGPGFDSCLNYIERNLDALGFQQTGGSPERPTHPGRYQILEDPPERKVWIPEDALLSLQSPEIRILYSFSSTPLMLATNSFSNDVTAPLAYVSGGNRESDYDLLDVKGRLVLCDAHPARVYRLALKRGAVGLLSAYVPPHNHPEKYPDIIANNGLPYDDQLNPFAIHISPRTAAELKQMMSNQQVVIRVQTRASFGENAIKTLVAEIPGSERPEQQIVLVAHLDHYKPGANDNASGAATLLEIVRSIAAGIREGRLPVPARTLTFLWVDEYRGTGLWMKHQGDKMNHVLAALALDMVGGDPQKTGGMFRVERMPDPGLVWFRPPEQHSGWGAGRRDKNKLFGSYLNDLYLSIVQGWSRERGWKTTQNVWEGGSDHDPFLRRGIPAILSWHFPDFAYHSSMDVIGNISQTEMKNAGVCIAAAAVELASGKEEVATNTLMVVAQAALQKLEALENQAISELEEAQTRGAQELEATRKLEREILDAWAKWYDEALASVLAIPVTQPSEQLKSAVDREREILRNKLRAIVDAHGLSM